MDHATRAISPNGALSFAAPIFAYSLLEPLLRSSNPYHPHQRHTGLQHFPPEFQEQYVYGGGGGIEAPSVTSILFLSTTFGNFYLVRMIEDTFFGLFNLFTCWNGGSCRLLLLCLQLLISRHLICILLCWRLTGNNLCEQYKLDH